MARKKDEAASGKMSLQQRLDNYKAGGRAELTPRQLRRAAHKAKMSTGEVQAKATKG